MKMGPTSDHEIVEDEPVTLAEVCAVFFKGRLKPSSLRSEARKGNLIIERIGNKDFVTLNARDMRKRCRVRSAPAVDAADATEANRSPRSAKEELEAKAAELKRRPTRR